jgi:MSHA biogenesis protein MshO
MNAGTAPHRSRRARGRGFTLLEATLVIALTGVVAAMVAVFITRPVNAYVDQARRGELSDTADAALRRIARELALALPNSARVDLTGRLLEFIPVSAGGRYRAAPKADGSGDFLDFDSVADGSFEVLGPAVDVAAGEALVVYNLGLPGADAYSGESRRALASTGSALTTLSYAVGASQFPFPSPGNRFQVVGSPVTYACAPGAAGTGTLRRLSGYAIQSAQPTNTAAAPLAALSGSGNSVVADKVTACAFALSSGASTGTRLVTLRLTLESGGEQLTLLHQVHVDNSP